jgi:hypothetical protein
MVFLGCNNTPVNTSERSPAPLRIPPPSEEGEGHGTYEDSLTGGQVFSMYCGYCHFPRSLAERPFANYQNAAAHMRVVADLTGEEYAKLMEFLRRFHDIPPPNPPVEPSPKKFIFSQPINELRPQKAPEPPKPGPAGAEESEAEHQGAPPK